MAARQRYIATQTLRSTDARLAGSNFQRVRRNALVNVNHVRQMTPLSNGQEPIVGKRQARNVRQMLQW